MGGNANSLSTLSLGLFHFFLAFLPVNIDTVGNVINVLAVKTDLVRDFAELLLK